MDRIGSGKTKRARTVISNYLFSRESVNKIIYFPFPLQTSFRGAEQSIKES